MIGASTIPNGIGRLGIMCCSLEIRCSSGGLCWEWNLSIKIVQETKSLGFESDGKESNPYCIKVIQYT